ncbi:MAG: DUF1499 domain-containing protein [Alphaproteobacteria bacterium]|jgi:hypothetical protein|nr:DUF1499 domain-containing protein [Alphaproteobacteria bacterium]MBT4711117.1 DUF1499 domain-containing protein [Alphaproteobacteria bacterium]MBT5860656.1 DUF1499 domain-containing protein [Alphaproteobacteria bacterium]
MKHFGWWFTGAVLIAGIFVSVLAVTPLGEKPFRAMFEPGEITIIDFAEVQLERRPNRFLVCPTFDLCSELNDRTAIFDAEVHELKARWDELVALEPRMELVLADEEKMQYVYIQRSQLFRLPDVFTVQFYDEGNFRSTLAIYSRGVYGSGDFGSNSSRVFRFIDGLEETLNVYRR